MAKQILKDGRLQVPWMDQDGKKSKKFGMYGQGIMKSGCALAGERLEEAGKLIECVKKVTKKILKDWQAQVPRMDRDRAPGREFVIQ